MPRKKISHGLPPLQHLVLKESEQAGGGNNSAHLLRSVRQIALELQQQSVRAFYTMNEVAEAFRVRITTVARVYRCLSGEGLLTTKRGAMTVLEPKRQTAHTAIRGIVAMPIWDTGFFWNAEQQEFYRHLALELRKRFMVGDMVFFSAEEWSSPRFMEKLYEHQPDFLLWLFPIMAQESMMHSIADTGVRILNIVSSHYRSAFPCVRLTSRDAVLSVCRKWKERGIKNLVTPELWEFTSDSEELIAIFKKEGFKCEKVKIGTYDFEGLRPYLRNHPDTAVFFCDTMQTYTVCLHNTKGMKELIVHYPVLTLNRLPYDTHSLRKARGLLEYAVYDWRALASRIATALSSGKLIEENNEEPLQANHLTVESDGV